VLRGHRRELTDPISGIRHPRLQMTQIANHPNGGIWEYRDDGAENLPPRN
jgi:hypothetical protein